MCIAAVSQRLFEINRYLKMLHECLQYNEIHNFLKNINIDPYPKIIEIHPIDVCNMDCCFCFSHFNARCHSRIVKKLLTFDEYSSLFTQMRELGILNLSISGGGEPFKDERIYKILKSAHENMLNTRIVTNGTILNYDIMEELLSAKEIRFSIDAINPETYSKIKNCSSHYFIKAMKNLKNLIKLKNQNNSLLNIGVSFLINEFNWIETYDFIDNMLKMEVDSIIIKYNIYDHYHVTLDKYNFLKKSLNKLDDKRLEIRYPLQMEFNSLKCFIHYFKVSFNPYGDLFSCCLKSQFNNNDEFLFGNLHEKAFREIWETSKDTRSNMHISGVSCTNCNYTDYKLNKMIKSKINIE